MNDDRPIREIYGDYRAGKIPWAEVTRATDRAIERFEQERGRRPSSEGARSKD